jgi:hypothetical protein
MDDENNIHVGRTTYYCVRKGGTHYRILLGKTMKDASDTWQVCSAGGKTWFVNLGTLKKAWHLPDIHQTPAEFEEEQMLLRKRKAEREAQQRQQEQEREKARADVIRDEARRQQTASHVTASLLLVGLEQEARDEEARAKKREQKSSCPCVVQ